MLLGALHLRTSKLFSLRAKRKFYNCSPFLGQNGRKTATTTTPPAKLAPTHAPARPSRALVAAWGRCAPILATPLLPQCHKQRPKRGVVTYAPFWALRSRFVTQMHCSLEVARFTD